MTAATLAPVSELCSLLAALVDALPDPAAEVKYRQLLCAEAYELGRVAGVLEERLRSLEEEAQQRREMASLVTGARPGTRYVSLTELELQRWGTGGRAHFADPQPGDYQGGRVPPW